MGGFVGCVLPDPPRASSTVDRMLRAEALAGRASRKAASLAIFGAGDIDLATSAAGAIVLAGYATSAGRRVGAAEVLRKWERAGPALLDTLAGEFSLATDLGGETLIARDRHGARPLYVAETDRGQAIFSTAIGPLLAAGIPAEPDRDAVVRSLVLGYVPAPKTALARVRQVMPGEYWIFERRAGRPARRHRYFELVERIARRRKLGAAALLLDETISGAVRRALPDSGRIGAFLSGGVDSSLVLARLVEEGRRPDAFTLHFGDDLPGELAYARAVAAHLGVRHHVLELRDRQFCDTLEPALAHLEDLLSEPIAVPNFLLAREAARTCDVLFTGEGGDPPFGGPKNIGLVLAHTYRAHPLAPSLTSAYQSAHHHLAGDLDIALTEDWRAGFDEEEFERMLRAIVAPTRRVRGTSFVGRLMRANIALKGGSNILVKVAKMVSAHDVALRSPLFDAEVVRVALTIPPWQKLDGTEEKLVLRRAARRSLPRIVVDRTKRGMAVPLSAWFKGALGALARDVLTRRVVRDRGIFRWEYVERLLRLERLPGDLVRSRTPDKLWLALVTELQQRALERMVRGAT